MTPTQPEGTRDARNGTSDQNAEVAVETRAASEHTNHPSSARRPALAKPENYILGSSAAIITNVGLIVGLGSAQSGKGPVLGALLTLALADNISDSLGIRLYKESEGIGERLSILATMLNFLSRLVISLSFIAIVLMFPMTSAIPIGISWALLLLIFVSCVISKSIGQNMLLGVFRHVTIAVLVIALSRGVGALVAHYFGE